MLNLATKYARLKSTKIFETPGGHRISDDGRSITFVMENGPKLTFTNEELQHAINELQHSEAVETAVKLARADPGQFTNGVSDNEASTAGKAAPLAPRAKRAQK